MKSNKILTLRQIINWAQEHNISLDTPVECYYGNYERHFEALGIVYETTGSQDENGDPDYDKFSELVGEHCYCKDGDIEPNHIVITDGQHYYDDNKLEGYYIVTVKELIKELEKYDPNLEVMTKKEEVFGNVGEIFNTKLDEYYFFGRSIKCVLIGDFSLEDNNE